MCLPMKNYRENIKVITALAPKGCPEPNKLRSNIYHPDFRTTDVYACSKNPNFIPTEEVLKMVKCKPDMPLYNRPRKSGHCGLKIISHDRRTNCCENYFPCSNLTKNNTYSYPSQYPHRDIKKLHENLRDPCNPCKQNIRPFLACQQCGCVYRAKKSSTSQQIRPCQAPENSCPEGPISVRMNCSRPRQQDNVIYFRVDISPPSENTGTEENEENRCICQKCRPNNDISRVGDHFPDCRCQLCKKREKNCPNRPSNNIDHCPDSQQTDDVRTDWSNPIWSKCNNSECNCSDSSLPNCEEFSNPASDALNSDLSRIQNETCQKVVIKEKDGKPTVVPCHFCFVVDNQENNSGMHTGSDYQSNCSQNAGSPYGPDTSTIPICGNGIAVNRTCKKQRNSICGCFHCEQITAHKKALHGPCCVCLTCYKLRCQSRKRPSYYNSLRKKGCSTNNGTETCFPTFSSNPSSSNNYTKFQNEDPCSQNQQEKCEREEKVCDPSAGAKKDQLNYVCPCHQFIPTNWERKVNCKGCPVTRSSDRIPRANCYKKKVRVGDREIRALCPPVLVRAMKTESKCDMIDDARSIKYERQPKTGI